MEVMAKAEVPITISHNTGASVPAEKVFEFADQMNQNEWKHNSDPKVEKIKIVRLSHMRYGHSNIDEITNFMIDFGMTVVHKTSKKVWFAGYGPDQYVYVAEKTEANKYLGGVFLVETQEDLERASRLPGGTPMEEIDDAPGGGFRVEVTDPEGFPVSFIWGQKARTRNLSDYRPETLVVNTEASKPRKGAFQRFTKGPAAVHKLGHFGLCIQDFEKTFKFYTTHFNIVPTDLLYIDLPDKSKKDVAAFCHIDRGDEYVDHHSFFMSSNNTAHVHHCSFEVHDFDTQVLGHHWLKEKSYKPVWNLGRHILGSQLFDYWYDTSDFMVEHYTDGDLVNDKTPIGRLPAGNESLAVWGPEVPSGFLD